MAIKAFLAAALLISPVACAAVPLQPRWNDTVRIIGGVDAQQDDVPYIVSVQRMSQHTCGGSLLDATTVLTAAHCVIKGNISDVTVRVGSLVCRLTPRRLCFDEHELTLSRLGPQEALSCVPSRGPIIRPIIGLAATLESSSSQSLSQMPTFSNMLSWLQKNRFYLQLEGQC